MEDTYPCLRCVFCNSMFSSLRAANFHLDHYLPEYCVSYETDLAVIASANHPVAAIREFRRKATRKRFIPWRRASVQPLDGTTWSFIVPVETEADARAAVRAGLKSATWWTKRLCNPIVPEPPVVAAAQPPPAQSRRGPTVSGIVRNNDVNVRLDRVAQVNSNVLGPRSAATATATATGTSDYEDTDNDSDADASPVPAPRRRRRAPAAVIAPVVVVATPSPQHRRTRRARRRVNFAPSPVISPFMKPAPPAPLTTLGIHVFGRVYNVTVTRAMSVQDAMGAMVTTLSGGFGFDVAEFGLAGTDGGEPWSEEKWKALKKEWMMGASPEAWLVALG